MLALANEAYWALPHLKGRGWGNGRDDLIDISVIEERRHRKGAPEGCLPCLMVSAMPVQSSRDWAHDADPVMARPRRTVTASQKKHEPFGHR